MNVIKRICIGFGVIIPVVALVVFAPKFVVVLSWVALITFLALE